MLGLQRLAAIALVWVVSATPAAADPPTIADFLEEPPVVDFAVSPNGALIAGVVEEGDNTRINILNSDTLERVRSMQLPGNMQPVWVEWANDERLLIAVVIGAFEWTARRISIPTARIIAIDTDGANLAVLFENQRGMRRNINLAVVTDMLPDDPNHVLMPGVRGGDLDLWKVNVYTGAAERIATGGPQTVSWRTDAAGNPAFRFDVNGRGTVMRIYAPDAEGAWRRVATVRREDLPEFMPVADGPEPHLSYVIARPEGADRAAVYLYNTQTNEFGDVIASHPRVDIGGVFVNPRTSEYLGYFTFDDVYETQFVDPRIQSHVNGLRRFFGQDASLSIIDMSDDHSVWVLAASAPSDPGWIYMYDREQRHIEALAPLSPSVQREHLGASSIVRYPTRDGAEITGYLALPPNAGAGPHPLVLMPHGGPEMRDFFLYDRDTQFLATRGYAVFRPNFRGSSGYGVSFAEAGYGEWGARMQDDLTDAVAYLVGTGVADPQRICIVGASYGGYAALAGAAFTPDLYRCAVSTAGVSDLADQARYVIREGDDDEDAYIRRSIGDPRNDRDRLAARSPALHAANIRIPVLLIHGDQDGIVTVEHSRKMDRALREAGGDVRYVEIEGEGHSGWSKENETTYLTEIEAFLARHLAPPTANASGEAP